MKFLTTSIYVTITQIWTQLNYNCKKKKLWVLTFHCDCDLKISSKYKTQWWLSPCKVHKILLQQFWRKIQQSRFCRVQNISIIPLKDRLKSHTHKNIIYSLANIRNSHTKIEKVHVEVALAMWEHGNIHVKQAKFFTFPFSPFQFTVTVSSSPCQRLVR